jgi:hypothetical protein
MNHTPTLGAGTSIRIGVEAAGVSANVKKSANQRQTRWSRRGRDVNELVRICASMDGHSLVLFNEFIKLRKLQLVNLLQRLQCECHRNNVALPLLGATF